MFLVSVLSYFKKCLSKAFMKGNAALFNNRVPDYGGVAEDVLSVPEH